MQEIDAISSKREISESSMQWMLALRVQGSFGTQNILQFVNVNPIKFFHVLSEFFGLLLHYDILRQ